MIQSATEFLPISSSGHLFLWHLFVDTNWEDFYWDAALHAGSLLALLIYFRKDIYRMVKDLRVQLFNGQIKNLIIIKIIVATIPAAAIGFFAEDWIKNSLRSVWLVIAMLIIVSLLFFWIEKKSQQRLVAEQLSWRQIMFIGLAQCLAFIPGTSRSGITIVAGMSSQLTRKEAARYSFLLAIPVLAGAAFKGILTIASQGTDSNTLIMLIIGLFITFVFSFLFVRFLLRYLEKYSLAFFAWYRLGLALLIIIILLYSNFLG